MDDDKICPEMKKFRQMLNEAGIVWIDLSDSILPFRYISRTRFFIGETMWSVINGSGAYGGFDLLNRTNEGLLEICDGIHEPIGWLTAAVAWEVIFGEVKG